MTALVRVATACLLLACLLPVAAPAVQPVTLPASLELGFTLRYGELKVGQTTKTLQREPDGSYLHRSRSIALGMATLFTSVEWMEEGRFEVAKGKVRPLSFLEYRVGADKAHRHQARFDWKENKIFYEGWPTVPLPGNTQDQGSILYALMLDPPGPGSDQSIPISSGKKLVAYHYKYVRSETLKTLFGDTKTTMIERPARGNGDETFRIWLASEHGNLPVRIATEKLGQETVMTLESVKGL